MASSKSGNYKLVSTIRSGSKTATNIKSANYSGKTKYIKIRAYKTVNGSTYSSNASSAMSVYVN